MRMAAVMLTRPGIVQQTTGELLDHRPDHGLGLDRLGVHDEIRPGPLQNRHGLKATLAMVRG